MSVAEDYRRWLSPPRTSRAAIASLCLGVLGPLTFGVTAVAGLILAIMAMQQIRQEELNLHGEGLALAGLCLGILGLAGAPVSAWLFFVVLAG